MNKKEQKTNDKPRKKRKLTVKERVKQRRKKAIITAVVSATAIVLVSVALIVLNVFIPVKYLASYFVVGNRMKIGDLRVSFIDVGYGDCIIIELPDGKNMLIDAGDGRYATNSKVLKELNKRDIDEIDYLICSSVNGEHCGGLFEVLKYKTVKSIFMPYCLNRYVTDEFRDFCEQAEKSKAEIIYSEYKKGIKTNDYFFTVLSPSVKEFENGEYTDLNTNPSKPNRNNASAVIWLEFGNASFLFTGDVESKILESIALSYEIDRENYPADLSKCNVVQIANHGNNASASPSFYDLIKPETAVLSVGDNADGSPSVKVISDVLNTGADLKRSDERGNIVFEVSPSGYIIK